MVFRVANSFRIRFRVFSGFVFFSFSFFIRIRVILKKRVSVFIRIRVILTKGSLCLYSILRSYKYSSAVLISLKWYPPGFSSFQLPWLVKGCLLNFLEKFKNHKILPKNYTYYNVNNFLKKLYI